MDISNNNSMSINNSVYNYRRYFDENYNNNLNSMENYNIIRNILNNYNFNEIFMGNDLIDDSLYDEEPYKKVIDDVEKNKLIYLKYDKNMSLDIDRCPITYKKIEEGDDIVKLPCNHIFIKHGIEKWLFESSNECPICRYKFKYKSILNDNRNNMNTYILNNTQISILNTLNNINLDD